MKSALDAAHEAYIARKASERIDKMAKLRAEAASQNLKQASLLSADGPPEKQSDAELELTTRHNSKGTHRKALRRRYKNLVWRLTENQDLSGVPNIHLRKWRTYDLDHIISIWDGFNHGIPPEIIANISNLRVIPHLENGIKGGKSHFDAHPQGQALKGTPE